MRPLSPAHSAKRSSRFYAFPIQKCVMILGEIPPDPWGRGSY